MLRHLSIALAAAVGLSGCLSTTHRIPHQELQRLAQTPPEQRGQRVRVIQGFVTDDQPPAAPRVQGGATVVVVGDVHVGGGHHHVHRHRPNPKKLAKAKADKAEYYVILAALAAVGLAVTEGARYDGWVQVHPMHPVHLYGPNGEYGWVPLAQLTPETAAWARKAYIRPEEGPWRPLGRAPLNRRGWTYSVLLGAGQIPSSGDTNDAGFLSHIQFGYFPTGQLGLQADIAFGWREDELANTVLDARYALELDAMLLRAGKFHAGGYGQIGSAALFDDGPGRDTRGVLLGAGVLLQLELTTRLALTGRAGIAQAHGERVQEFTAGLSIY